MFHAGCSNAQIRLCLHFNLNYAAGALLTANRNGEYGEWELAAVVQWVASEAYGSEPSGCGRVAVLTETL